MTSDARRRLLALSLACASVLPAVSGCAPDHDGRGRGTVRGALPICYGPGPDDNLEPHVRIDVYGAQGFHLARTFEADSDLHRYYELTLPVGRYRMTASDALTAISVEVKRGRMSTGDFASLGCA